MKPSNEADILINIHNQIKFLTKQAVECFKTNKIKIVSDFHDQPCGGISRKNLKGKIVTIKNVHFDNKIYFSTLETSCYLPLEKIEFI